MTVMAGTVAALICVVLIILIMFGVRGRTEDYKRNQATSAALRVAFEVGRNPVRGPLAAPDGVVLQLVDGRGGVLASTRARSEAPIARFRPVKANIYRAKVLCPPRGLDGCMWVVAFRVSQPYGDRVVYAATPTVPWYVTPGLLMLLVCVALLVTFLVCLRTWGTVDQTLAPVEAIRTELTEITASESGRRVTVPENQDEIRRLAEAANATLDRLDTALARQRGFTSDASHDLRSPIAAARAQIEEALLRPDDVDWPTTAGTVLQSLERLQAIVTDLLQLARLDAAAWQDSELIDLGALVTIEIARAERTKRVVPHIQDGVTVLGDRLRLVRLLTNLLDNAERHAETRIDIVVRLDDAVAVLEVIDDGEGIAGQDRDLVFQRFARLAAGKSRDAAGTGLGLPIAREIARLHGGTLTIEDSVKGARFVLRIPRDRTGGPRG
ncbi:sensor histidine kinase [Actinomadura spongiicola]|uniref:histidine kinase n=1 Tax=Actinomadura spongiicola TaxID=2303421 RepID=A0A372G891_9ACTN|nr:HAMP domain-containing sensor histidine kinase [Actinomadura spongiicola]RFS81359.1 sensor histidine kinase [Actinomadura spongiicola]